MFRNTNPNLGHQTSQDIGELNRISYEEHFILVHSFLYNQLQTPCYWSHDHTHKEEPVQLHWSPFSLPLRCGWGQGGSPARGQPGTGCNCCAFLRHWVLAEPLASLMKKIEDRRESMQETILWGVDPPPTGRRTEPMPTDRFLQCT